ncbi:nitrilase-related carbon-nitrogen hydrolase, partial [Gemmatimonas sp.]|uniref:nitrilase-related carbon-nitrogen hydrolase n=1 Tax=Gemmatimonas sp. TaxID=1962908 RepID=UPI0037BE7C97
MANIVTIGIVQDTASDDLEANVTKAVARVRDAAAKGAQIICLQELFNAPYFCKSVKPERFDIAQATDGPIVHTFQVLAKELAVVIVVPYYEREAPGLYRNSATVIDADGSVLGTYRKMHIPHDPLFEEKYYFAPGDVTGDQRADKHPGFNGFRVWRTKYADIGVLICWDQWYPEGARITALLGA